MKLSVIIPAASEWPTAPFTVRSIYEELKGRVDFEILYVDNSMKPDGKEDDKAYNQMVGVSRGLPELVPLKYSAKLSHWQAKNHAISKSTGDILWFCDAHCAISRDALFKMYNYFSANHEEINGTLHLPLTYHIMEYHKLIYKLAGKFDKGEAHYTFSAYRPPWEDRHFKVPCMSTCGMMMTKALYHELGGWPTALGIYGGGENFLNYSLAVIGKTVNIMPGDALYHHGDKRGYSWNFDDHLRNKFIATYCFGGKEFVELFKENSKGRPEQKQNILDSVLKNNPCIAHRELIKSKQVVTIQDWWASWQIK